MFSYVKDRDGPGGRRRYARNAEKRFASGENSLGSRVAAFFSHTGTIKPGGKDRGTAGEVAGEGRRGGEENEGTTVLHIGWYLRPFISEFITAFLG